METPFSYNKGSGFLYRIPAGIKLLFFFCLSIAVFVLHYYFIFIGCAIIFTLSIIAKIAPWKLLKGSVSIFVIIVAIILFQSLEVNFNEVNPIIVHKEGLESGVLLGLRMLVSFCAGALFFTVTTMCEILRSLSAVEKFLCLEKLKISLGISLMLGFIPKFFEIWEQTDLAFKSRKGKGGLVKIITLIPIIIDRLMEKAAGIAEALESRGCN